MRTARSTLAPARRSCNRQGPVEHQECRMSSVNIVDEVRGGMANEPLHGSAFDQVLRTAIDHSQALNRVRSRQR